MKNNTPPPKKDEEKDWKEELKHRKFTSLEFGEAVKEPLDPTDYDWLVTFISRLLRKEHTLINEKTAKLVQESYHTGFQAALKQIGEATKVDFLHPDKAMQQLLQKAFNDGYEKALDERKGEV